VGELNFNNKQCIRALQRIGFYLNNKRHGQHDKYFPPNAVADNIAVGRARFIMIPRHKDLHCQSEILSELRMMGGDDLVELGLQPGLAVLGGIGQDGRDRRAAVGPVPSPSIPIRFPGAKEGVRGLLGDALRGSIRRQRL